MSLLSLLGFTNLGYWLHSRTYGGIEADLSGRTIVVTGGTGGLGRAASRGLARLGARIIVVGRSRDKLDSVSREIDGEVVGYEADLSLMSQIRNLGERLIDQEQRIDVLINNVGVLLPERETTREGVERTLATNLAGHFLLTNLLIPRLVESAPARIINVTSGGMYSERIRPDDLQFERGTYQGTTAYAHAKRGQVILTEMWARKLQGTGVTAHAMHPGWARTPGIERSLPTFNKLMGPLLRDAEQGADTMIWLAVADEPQARSGELWFDRRPVPTHMVEKTRESSEDRVALWEALVDLTGSDMPDRLGG